MNGGSIDGHALALVLFVAFVSVSLLLCGLAAADSDDPEQFYTGSATARPAASGLAVAGDYISVATLLSTTGSVALVGYDGVLFAFATVLSLTLLALVLARPLRGRNRFTLGDLLSERLGERSVRVAMGVAVLVTVMPLLVVQLAAAGEIMTVMLDLPGDALTGCTIATGALMVCFSASGGMRGTGYVQILKTVVLVGAVLLLAGLVLSRFGWSPPALWDAAAEGSGQGSAYGTPGLQFGDSVTGTLDLIGFHMTLALGAACMPHVMMRLHPVRSGRHVRATMGWAVGAVALVCGGVVVVGLGAAALVGAPALRAADPAGGTALLMVTAALDPGVAPAHSVLFAIVAIAVFATTLAAVAGIAVAAAASVAHDLAPSARRRSRTAGMPETGRARRAVLAVGAVAVLLSVLAQHRNPQILFSFTFAVAASAIAPVVLCVLFVPGTTARGVRWALYGTPLLTAVLMAVSPATSGIPTALFPGHDFHVFPLQTPGLVTIPAGFALCLLGSRLRRRGDGRPGRSPDGPAHWAAAQQPAAEPGNRP
ncbi:sodium:solute symporter family transporter [Streptomyces genisteinicus]|uniref:Cation acetate symporter n=1 Tax=Streptomyces genisteinicus TaxID=2768068 RepID=A0A7H0I2J1_9ACTN|nr:cation acetate symporter [Streptomyces genisteinicus]QNP67007.1 cation acetate symporter [Streptomyces genisteinicus]